LAKYSLFDIPQDGKAIIYRSSAGSGKTFTLTKAFLKLVLLDPSRYTEVLAITFTNDAKNEMKNRIISELTELADDADTAMRQAILDDFEKEGIANIKDVITSRSSMILSHLLHDYSRFNVSTIDHFFAQLIRHLAKELKLNLGYELDVDTETALNESIKQLFAQADKQILSWLQDYALDQIEADKGWNIKRNIAELGVKLFHESYLDIQDDLIRQVPRLADFVKNQQMLVSSFKKKLITAGQQGVDAAARYGLVATDFKRSFPLITMEQMANSTYKWDEQPKKSFMEARSLDQWHTRTSDKVSLIEQARDNGMGEAYDKIIALYEGPDFGTFLEANAILKYIHAYGVLIALAKQVQSYRTSNNILLISDTAFILNKVIQDQEMPFIYEKIGAKYRYILIDEFQDTSVYQWKSLLPFFNQAIDDGGQLIVVGDIKQSIYGWRGGDMNLLLHQVEKDIHVPQENIKSLDRNFRSSKNVVAFNNSFFKNAQSRLPAVLNLEEFKPEFTKAYADVEQTSNSSRQGYVEVRFFEKDETNSWQDYTGQATLEAISQARASGFRYADVLILTRKREEAKRIAGELIEAGVQAISDEALAVDNSSKVKLLLSAFHYLLDENNLLAIAEFNFFRAKLTKERFSRLNEVSGLLKSLAPLKNRPVYELLEELILKLNLHERPDLYLQRFQDICLEQSTKGNATLDGFLEWWSEVSQRDNPKELAVRLPETDESVRVMTVHKAKGLERQVVILPYADAQLDPRSGRLFWGQPLPEPYEKWRSLPLTFNKNLTETRFAQLYQRERFEYALEALNLLYVGFTRAAERLYIFSNKGSKDGNSGKLIWDTLTDENFEFTSRLDKEAALFQLGEATPAHTAARVQVITPIIQEEYPVSPLPGKIALNHKSSDLFLTYTSEKSQKVKQGLLLHLVMSRISHYKDIPLVVQQLYQEQAVPFAQVKPIIKQLETLFDKNPELHNWFDNDWQIINERKIFSGGKIHIPDRVMLKDGKAVVIDYKLEQQHKKHHDQVNRYAGLLTDIGYQVVKKYLVYIDDFALVEVE
jgi:ATP-dependent exoDNAse (exonuclease V) beta subunit